MDVTTYISKKASKGAKSKIEGRGLFAIKPIKKGEIVAIKGGRIIDWETLKKHEKLMMFLNHSCNPSVGVRGEITFTAMRDIKAGEELTIDYAMIDDDNYKMKCYCGEKNCRKVITGKDWKKKNLQ